MSNNNKKLLFLRKRFAYAILIIVTAICLIESGLRIGGYIVLKLNPPLNSITKIKDKSKVVILCLGDSYTFGIGAAYQYSYPRQLERILNERFSGSSYEVYNLGIPGSNSSQLVNNMQDNVDKYDPDILIVMTGRNDTWNLTDATSVLVSSKIDLALTRLKIYKLIKIIMINLREKVTSENTIISKIATKRKLSDDYNKDNKVRKNISPEANQQVVIGHNFAVQARPDLAKKCFLKALELDPGNISANRQLGTIYREQAKYELAEEHLNVALAKEDGTKDLSAYLELGMIHGLQNRYGLAKEELKEAIMDPQLLCLAFNELLQLYKDREDFFNDMENFKKQIKNKKALVGIESLLRLKKDQECIYKIMYANLVKIEEISKRNNIRVVFQTYPNPGTDPINENIQRFAKRYRSLLADNYLIFQKKLAVQDKKNFFVADEHCNAKGYRIIAQNVYRILLRERIINNVINNASGN